MIALFKYRIQVDDDHWDDATEWCRSKFGEPHINGAWFREWHIKPGIFNLDLSDEDMVEFILKFAS